MKDVNYCRQRGKIFPLLGVIILFLIVGIGSYYFGSRTSKPLLFPIVSREKSVSTQSPAVTATIVPQSISKITYNLPTGWKLAKDTTGRFEVGYDSSRYNATSSEKEVDLSGKWVEQEGKAHRLGWNQNFSLTGYSGGSRHAELYKILGVTAEFRDWKSPKYSEREYLYNGWNCLVINGVSISQYPVAWGYCPISSTEALVLAFDGPNWSEVEQQLSAVRLLK